MADRPRDGVSVEQENGKVVAVVPTDEDILISTLAEREMARRSFAAYLPYVHGPAWRQTRMAAYLAEQVQTFIETPTDHAYDILVIQTPPQHGKSMTLSESLPAWVLGRHPTWRVIEVSYNDESAQRFCRRNADKIRDHGAVLFGEQAGVGQVDRSTEVELSNNIGKLISRGVMSGITGNPANLILIDDPIKNRAEADSETFRTRLWSEWVSSIKTRLAAGAKVIVISTPWHEDDLMANILRTEPHARLIRLPVEAEPDDPLGRAVGDALCPELGKDNKWLAEFKASYINDPMAGARAWQALYQCSPRVEGGNIVQRSWWRRYTDEPTYGNSVISVDAAFKGGENNDYVAITVWGKIGCDYYLRYCLRKHLDFPQTLTAIRTVRSLYPDATAVLIEDKANGSAIIQTLQAECFCIPVNPKGGKEARVHAVSPAIESGHVYLPETAPWLEEYLDEWSVFPAGAHDDMVDSSTQALSYLLRLSGYVEPPRSEEERVYDDMIQREEDCFLGDDVFNPYGGMNTYE